MQMLEVAPAGAALYGGTTYEECDLLSHLPLPWFSLETLPWNANFDRIWNN